jgi:uncharacterized protein (TIGR00730 family)
VTHPRAVCVFCGSSPGTNPAFTDATAAFGRGLATRDVGLVYGGASIGLMGVVADAAIAAGGRATGVITEALAGHEIAHSSLTDLHTVNTMHERKAMMSSLSDAFAMLPGGFGTLEEFMESVTWSQLGLHNKRCGILNIDGFFDDLLDFVGHAVDEGFINAKQVDRLIVAKDASSLLDALVGPARDPSQVVAR